MIKRVLKTVIKILILVAIIAVILNVRIKSVEVIGNNKVGDEIIISSLFEKKNDDISLLFFLKNKIKGNKKIKLINSYSIKWITPFKIEVIVNEKTPIAFVRRDINNLYIDREGTIIEMSEERKEGLIEIAGVDFRNYDIGEELEFDNKKLFNALLNIASFLKENNLKASLIEIQKESDIYIYVDRIVAYMGDTRNMEIKLQRLIDIYPKISDLSGTLDLSEARENMLDEQYIFKKN